MAFRLIDSAAFKEIHQPSTGSLAIVASHWFFDEVIWHSDTAERDTYRQIHVSEKEPDTGAAAVNAVHPAPGPRSRPGRGQSRRPLMPPSARMNSAR